MSHVMKSTDKLGSGPKWSGRVAPVTFTSYTLKDTVLCAVDAVPWTQTCAVKICSENFSEHTVLKAALNLQSRANAVRNFAILTGTNFLLAG